ncbi:MAG: hypothetical protein A2785_02930 [Candidatus Chisholmbacteria bacterium RIFCSPHIGHO2_01_FULL_49_18]|uniref:Uncharacterized protein n=1 Tax=Candidatus Chisholmbacteria bacterium RIFCSPHIGHO2_01_FULL_49_18 TaxID=1797590 RepID=A0A1G1VMG0_9BACT|nr:MAG: hypothetical protein A2785_02930 [Candidatus Chisholmbacteria bacterium RIFCSPHIGHO2_01_FULL_49_18]
MTSTDSLLIQEEQLLLCSGKEVTKKACPMNLCRCHIVSLGGDPRKFPFDSLRVSFRVPPEFDSFQAAGASKGNGLAYIDFKFFTFRYNCGYGTRESFEYEV